ncbi:hypothetical protein G7066_02530 [Leucobacter coleopterorum]|uniref:MotA/TolQ/ExbB proton channel domain-containing protein n=1 Tax=Leucobacter coleopterorum TaxID=2714933 RepID=A0ABX6JU87_9MICO|nr:hypothetical protein [Leucobacter coleopterorum]QIM17848.1 hypothetical protein G7066_02530 [Leucobacter coleopterorum]
MEGNQITGGVVGDLIFTLICALVGFGFFWSVLKTQSQLRWMVRNWNAATLETAKTGWLKEKRRRLGKLASDWEAPDVETARADAFVLFDIARVWFWSQFVRVYIKADYRIGDSLIVGQSVGGIIKWHPAEYVTIGKAGRIMMIVSTLMPLGLGLALLNVSRVTKLSGVMEDPVGFYAWAVMTILSGWFVLGSQAFLRWMLRNWNTKM